jgi:hypothetical protein
MCYECGKKAIMRTVLAYEFQFKHDGIMHTTFVAQLPVLQCFECKEILFDNVSNERINQAIREHLGLLSPGEIEGALAAQGYSNYEVEKLVPKLEDILTGCWIQTYEEDYKLRTLLGIAP